MHDGIIEEQVRIFENGAVTHLEELVVQGEVIYTACSENIVNGKTNVIWDGVMLCKEVEAKKCLMCIETNIFILEMFQLEFVDV